MFLVSLLFVAEINPYLVHKFLIINDDDDDNDDYDDDDNDNDDDGDNDDNDDDDNNNDDDIIKYGETSTFQLTGNHLHF